MEPTTLVDGVLLPDDGRQAEAQGRYEMQGVLLRTPGVASNSQYEREAQPGSGGIGNSSPTIMNLSMASQPGK